MKKQQRPSRITTPANAHPFARLTFDLMRKQGVTYLELEHRSGLLVTSLKSWRKASVPSLTSIEAVFGALDGWRLVPCPPIDSLPDDVREKLEEVGLALTSDDETLAAAIAATLAPARPIGTAEHPAPLIDFGRNLTRGQRRYRRENPHLLETKAA